MGRLLLVILTLWQTHGGTGGNRSVVRHEQMRCPCERFKAKMINVEPLIWGLASERRTEP